VEELVRRITGRSLAALFNHDVRTRYDVACYLGLPAAEEPRLVTSTNGEAFDSGSSAEFARLALNMDTPGFPSLPEMEKLRAVRAAAPLAVGAVATARGLAKAYAAAVTGVDQRPPLLSARTVDIVSQPVVTGADAVLGFDTSFALGFQTPTDRLPLSGRASFGHDGFAGSLGLADPIHGIAFGYLTDWIPEPDGGADPFAHDLVQTIRERSRRSDTIQATAG
jgi:CubicO group peptidase (beta-lactamase class C family)